MKKLLIILRFSISICHAQTIDATVNSMINAGLVTPNKNIAVLQKRADSIKTIFTVYDAIQKRVAQIDSLQTVLKTKLVSDSLKFISLNNSIKSLTDSTKKLRSDYQKMDTLKVRFYPPLYSKLDTTTNIINIHYQP